MGLVKKNKKSDYITPLSNEFYDNYSLVNVLKPGICRPLKKDILTSEAYYSLALAGKGITQKFYNSSGTLLRENLNFIKVTNDIVSKGFITKKKYIFIFEIDGTCSIFSLDGLLFRKFKLPDVRQVPNASSIFHFQNNVMIYRSDYYGHLIVVSTNGVLLGTIPWDYYSTQFYEVSPNEVLITRQLQSSGYSYSLYSIENNKVALIRSETKTDSAVDGGNPLEFINKKEGGRY